MNSTLALISGLGLGLGLETSGLGLGLGLETPGLVNIPDFKSPSKFLKSRRRVCERKS